MSGTKFNQKKKVLGARAKRIREGRAAERQFRARAPAGNLQQKGILGGKHENREKNVAEERVGAPSSQARLH